MSRINTSAVIPLKKYVALLVALVCLVGANSASAVEHARKVYASPQTRITGKIDDNDRVTLTRNRHLRLDRAQDVGRADDSLRIERMVLTLSPDAGQNAALERFLAEANDPASPQFGRWMTPNEFGQQFGVSDADLATVSRWLAGHGFAVGEIPAGHRSIVFSGTVQQIRGAFHTEMHRYRVDNEDHIANASDPEIPDSLSSVINGITSLHDFRSRPMHINVRPAPSYTSGSTHAMSPADFYQIYNLKPVAEQSINGAGRSIAVLGRTDVVIGDIQQFQSAMGLPANLPQIIYNGANPGYVSGDEGESYLDLEWAGAVAPGTTIKFVTSKSTALTDGIDLSAQYAVNNNVADIISLSYGLCEADLGTSAINFYNGLWQQAAAQGMSVFVSSGDSGAAGCEGGNTTTSTRGRAVNGLCSSPYSTCVGGTQFNDTANSSLYWSTATNPADQSSVLSYIPEVVWTESGDKGGTGLWSSGGGASTVLAKPTWQSAPGVPNDGKRNVPDVSLSAASHDGYLVYSSDNASRTRNLYIFGGTSASAPAMAGIMALINQKTGYRQGNANPRFYQLATLQAAGGPAYYHLITSGNNSVPGLTGYAASAGTPYYNLASGLGSVDGNVLVNHWTDFLPSTTTTLAATASTTIIGQNVTFTATVTGATPSGTVQFKDGATNLGDPVTLTNGVASLSTSTLTPGNHSVSALYSGDIANNASVSSAVPVVVSKAPTAISLSSSNPATSQGQNVTFSATVSGHLISGTLQFMDGVTSLGTLTINNCTMTLSTSALSAGSHNITAVYSGDANNLGSISSVVVQTVAPVMISTSTSLSASAFAISVGQSLSLTATVTGSAPGGTVQFKDGLADLGAPVTLSGNVATLNTAGLAPGNHALTAVYSGDTTHTSSTSGAVSVEVLQVTSSVSLVSDQSSSIAGEAVTLTATVNGYMPGGSVQFIEGVTELGTGLISNGVATLTTTVLTVGTHSISASYAGDAYNSAGTSSSILLTVNPATTSAGDSDTPTLPEWAAILMGLMLMAVIWRHEYAAIRSS